VPEKEVNRGDRTVARRSVDDKRPEPVGQAVRRAPGRPRSGGGGGGRAGAQIGDAEPDVEPSCALERLERVARDFPAAGDRIGGGVRQDQGAGERARRDDPIRVGRVREGVRVGPKGRDERQARSCVRVAREGCAGGHARSDDVLQAQGGA